MFCLRCGGACTAEDRFCRGCGTAQQASQTPPLGERRQLTVLFGDLVDSTALSVSLDPEDLQDIIGTYHRVCSEAVAHYAGVVSRFMGDGVLAHFGYPAALEHAAESAVRAGLAMIEAAAGLQTAEGRLRLRVGIATGIVVVGEDGTFRMDVVGHTPNLAAHLQKLAVPGTVVVSHVTRNLLRARFEFTDMGLRTLKGFKTPMRVWSVARESRIIGRFQALHVERVNDMVGRAPELALILDRWRDVVGGCGKTVIVSGEGGMGKSRLVHAALEQLQAEDAVRLAYQCSPFHRNSALHPVLEQIRQAADFAPLDTPSTRLAKFDKYAHRLMLDHEAKSLLAYLLSLPGHQSHPRQELTVQGQMDATLAVLAKIVAAAACRRPLLIVFEDVHWADPTSFALLELLNQLIAEQPVLLLITCRLDNVPRWSGPHVSMLTLNHLEHLETLQLLDQLTRRKPLPIGVRNQIVEKTDGVPLFVEELTKAIFESGAILETAECYELALPLRPITVPTTLRDSLMARLDRLGPVREVAQIGATIGRSFDRGLLAALMPMPEHVLSNALQTLEEAGLIFSTSTDCATKYTFKHALIQDTAYDSLLRAQRKVLHGRVARTLADQLPDNGADQPELLAHHYTLAGDIEQAVQHWVAAGQRAAERASPREAIGHFEKALAVSETSPHTEHWRRWRLKIMVALITPTMSLHGYGSHETATVISNARVLAESLGETSQIFTITYGEWVAVFARGKIKSSLRLAERFMALARSGAETTPLVVAHRMLGGTLINLGELSAGAVHMQSCIRLYDPEAHSAAAFAYGQDSRVSALAFLSWALMIQGKTREAASAARSAVSYANETRHAHSRAVALCLAGLFTHIIMRRDDQVQEHVDEALAVTAGNGLAMWFMAATVAKGWLLARRGSLDAGMQEIRKGIEGLSALDIGILRPFFLGLLAEAHLRNGSIVEGLSAIAEAQALISAEGERIWDADTHRIKAELLMQGGGDDGLAEASLLQAMAIARAQDARYWMLRAARPLALIWSSKGKVDEARALLENVRMWFVDAPYLQDVQTASVAMACLDGSAQAIPN